MANFCSSLSFQILTPTLPLYIQKQGHSQAMIGFIVGILTFTTIIFRPFMGKAVDTWSRKSFFIIGMAILSVSIFSYQFSESILSLTILRLFHGVGWGMVTAAAGTIAADFIPSQRIGEGMAYYGLSTVFSMAVAPILGLNLVEFLGFQSLFITTTLFTILGIIFGSLLNYKGVNLDKEIFNVSRSLFERSAFKPSVINFFISLTFSSITTFIALYAADLNIRNIGSFFTVLALTLIIIRPITGKFVDRKGFHFVMLPGLIALFSSIVIITAAKGLLSFLAAAIIYGIGFGILQPSLQALVVYRIPPRRRGAANSTFLLSSDLAFGVGAILWGFIADFAGYRTMYMYVLIPVVCGLIILLFMKENETGCTYSKS